MDHSPVRTLARAPVFDGWLRVGSLSIRASIEHESDRHALDAMFKQCLVPLGDGAAPAETEGTLSVARVAEWERSDLAARVEPDGLLVDRRGATLRVATEVVTASLTRSNTPWHAEVRVRAGSLAHDSLRVHLSVVLHRLLLALDAAYLHAAAVSVNGVAHLFVGEKGAGKTTLCLSLARRGATVLSDDHVLVRRRGNDYVVSGCERLSRVTAQTEAFLFERPLAVDAADFAGTTKKEFTVADHFRSAPFEDTPIHAIHFPRVGRGLASRRRSAMETTVDLLGRTRKSYRPKGPDDVAALLHFWSGLAACAPAYALELSAELEQLTRIDAVLA